MLEDLTNMIDMYSKNKQMITRLNTTYMYVTALICAVIIGLSACSLSHREIDASLSGYDDAYEKRIIRLKEPIVINLAVNNLPKKTTLRSFPGYTDDELKTATINEDQQAFDRVNSLLIDELEPNDYEIIPGEGITPVAEDKNKKIKSIDINDKAPKLKLMAIPASGIITIYANVKAPRDGTNFPFGNNINDRSHTISNDYHILDFESKGSSRLVNQGYDPFLDGTRNKDKTFTTLFAQGKHIPMSVRFFNSSALGGKFFAAYQQDDEPQEIGTIYLERAFALLKIEFETPKPGEPDFEYRAYTFYNYPYYYSYLAGDFDKVRSADGFNYSEGQEFSPEHMIDGPFNMDTNNPRFFVLLPENDPQKKNEQLFLKLRVKKNGEYVVRDIPLGVRQRNGLLKITRNQKYEAKVVVYVDGISLIYYRVVPFVEKTVNVPTFE